MEKSSDFNETVAEQVNHGQHGGTAYLLEESKSNAADLYDMDCMGKPIEMKRNFQSITMFGFSVIPMASWEGILSTSVFGLGNGGSAGLLYTNLATWIGFLAVYASMGEQGSMAPTSGGQYHWVSEFSSRKYQQILSYLVGWLGVLGWQVGVAFGAYLAVTQTLGLVTLNTGVVFERWHGTLVTIAILLIAVVFNVLLGQKLHLVEGFALFLHIAGFFCIIIPLLVLSEKASSKEVWTTFYDPGWGNQGLSCLIGIVASVSPLLGADASGKVVIRCLSSIMADDHSTHGGRAARRCIYIATGYVLGDFRERCPDVRYMYHGLLLHW